MFNPLRQHHKTSVNTDGLCASAPLSPTPGRKQNSHEDTAMLGTALKIGFGLICFAIGAASLIGAISSALFVSASDAHIPIFFGALGAVFLWFAFLLLRRLRWHNN